MLNTFLKKSRDTVITTIQSVLDISVNSIRLKKQMGGTNNYK